MNNEEQRNISAQNINNEKQRNFISKCRKNTKISNTILVSISGVTYACDSV